MIDEVAKQKEWDINALEYHHDKVYEKLRYSKYPAHTRWICRHCGEQGEDLLPYYPYEDYESIVWRFRDV